MSKILYADDSTPLHGIVKNYLKGEDHEITCVADGASILKILLEDKDDSYQLILLDWEMPEPTGIDVLKKLRSESVKTPIIMVTAKNNPKHIEEALNSGANDYMMKPFTKDILLQKIQMAGFFEFKKI